jgi:hypothetical protein
MTPQDYVDRIAALIRDGHDEAALALAERHSRDMLPRLSAEQLVRVGDMLEGAALAVEIAAAARAARPEPGPAPVSAGVAAGAGEAARAEARFVAATSDASSTEQE